MELRIIGNNWQDIIRQLEGIAYKEPEATIVEGAGIYPELNGEEKEQSFPSPTEMTAAMEEAISPPVTSEAEAAMAEVPSVGSFPTSEPQEELDSAGNLWDSSLHASTKTKVKNGTWKLKRGVIPPPANPSVNFVNPVTQAPTNLQEFTLYANKIHESGKGSFPDIQAFLVSISIPVLSQVPEEKMPGVAEQLRTKFQVEF